MTDQVLEPQCLSHIPPLASGSHQTHDTWHFSWRNFPTDIKTPRIKCIMQLKKCKGWCLVKYLCVRPEGVYFLHHPFECTGVLWLKKNKQKCFQSTSSFICGKTTAVSLCKSGSKSKGDESFLSGTNIDSCIWRHLVSGVWTASTELQMYQLISRTIK